VAHGLQAPPWDFYGDFGDPKIYQTHGFSKENPSKKTTIIPWEADSKIFETLILVGEMEYNISILNKKRTNIHFGGRNCACAARSLTAA